MNKSILCGRLVGDPDVRYTTNGDNQTCIARFTLAVDRRFKRDGEDAADFIRCVAFGKSGEFVEKYFKKGMKMGLSGRIQTGSYVNKDNQKVYTTDVVAEEIEFVEKKADSTPSNPANNNPAPNDFMDIPIGNSDDIPFV